MKNQKVKLNLGSGNAHNMKELGFTNIDIHKTHSVDIVHDIEKRLVFDDDSVDEIYSSHSLEHCSMAAVPTMLNDWKRILKKGGKIVVIVPEIEACMRTFLKTPETNRDKWGWQIEYILGGQHHQAGQQLHKSAFTPTHLQNLVESAGLVVSSNEIRNNGKNDCIHLTAYKP